MRFYVLFYLLWCMTGYTETLKGVHCGPRGSFWGTIASDYVIPDYFPPENPLLRALFIDSIFDLSACEESFLPVHLGASCYEHDVCYATLGAEKDRCDEDLSQGWKASCDQRYSDSSYLSGICHFACQTVVDFMYQALRYDDGVFCPSCIAFDESQKRAQRKRK